mmetsp:Transcript_104419/g.300929  ORF Transcript_104419/g.300929 Transcript_104419/m.300929 type:complete len:214 (-) Transcript_104419:144-785(-)
MPSTMMNGRRRRFGQTMLAATSQMRTTTMGAVTCHSPLRIMLERNVNCAQTHAARCCANQLAHQLPCAASSSCPSGHVTHSARFDAPSSTGEASIPSSKQVATHRRAASSMRKLAATQMIMVMNGEHHPRPTYDRSSCWKLVKSAHTLTLFLYRVTCRWHPDSFLPSHLLHPSLVAHCPDDIENRVFLIVSHGNFHRHQVPATLLGQQICRVP